ncbi:30S ribosomal protein S11 [Acropora cervicornis]|uniref:30S ribosomal protein S11 n=1 Tax=Acropora cervicornis TaxID=6130 RepID=A0AAD9QNB3_ACRCE|nr:30S ribosomal protein S11 [Acropora cervicornis]
MSKLTIDKRKVAGNPVAFMYSSCLELCENNGTQTKFVGSYLQIKEHYKRSAAQAAKYKNLPIIQINASFNNTVITLSDPKGKTLGWVSAKALSLGVESARIKVCGIGTGRQGAINGIEAAGVRVVSVTDVTPVPHNGCRPRKARRL